MIAYSIVIPTLGRPCLAAMLESLAAARGPAPRRILLVDDRPRDGWPLTVPPPLASCTDILTAGGRGPAAARNMGWRAADTPWVVFLDDDVRVAPDWREALAAALDGLADRIAGVQGLVSVPLPADRRPTDWERGTAGLARARWITADMAYRRDALVECGGFDERFPRAFREDADLALRVLADGWRLETGWRRTEHPVRPASAWISVKTQRGNADDALMRAVHGPGWPERAGETRGRRTRHLAIVGAALTAAGLAVAGLRRSAATAATAAFGGIAEFAAARIIPGPRTAKEVATMAATSVLIPPAAVWHWARGTWRSRCARPWPAPPKAILFDRDGTLIEDEPYNGDPDKVVLVPTARDAVELARSRGLRIGVVSNQSGIARGLVSPAQVTAVNDRVEELLGPFGTWQVCPHGPDDGCSCRKPEPGMVRQAADELGVDPADCVVIGDIGPDLAAAHAAGARGVLVPTAQTRHEELAGARIAADLREAVEIALGVTSAALYWPGEPGAVR